MQHDKIVFRQPHSYWNNVSPFPYASILSEVKDDERRGLQGKNNYIKCLYIDPAAGGKIFQPLTHHRLEQVEAFLAGAVSGEILLYRIF